MNYRPNTALDLQGKTLVVGLGKSGLSMVRALMNLGAEQVVVTDSRAVPPGLSELRQQFPDLAYHLGAFDAEVFADATRILVSPGISVQTPEIASAVNQGIPVWGDVELFARLTQAPVVAITGSNGKSTVTTMLGMMAHKAGLRAAVGGNLGTPVLELLSDRAELYVLELSSFQLETTHSLAAQAAVVLNISPDHLDRYPDLDAYVAAKQRIFRVAKYKIINRDDPRVAAMTDPQQPGYSFGLGGPKHGEFGLRYQEDKTWLAFGEDCWLAVDELKVAGAYNQANALAALALGQAIGLERSAMVAALRTFTGLSHRSQLVLEHGGVRWFNDSKGTNVGATVAAVSGLPGRVILIAGGEGKDQDFTPLRAALANKVQDLVLLGRDAALIAEVVNGTVSVHRVDDMAQAVAVAADLAQAGDHVLLSPACASFDMFENYEQRGRVFAAAVHRLATC